MFKPLHLALAASAVLAISAGARSDSASDGDSAPTITTRDKTPLPAPAICQGDLTGDRRVDVLDLIEVILGWGTCPDDALPAGDELNEGDGGSGGPAIDQQPPDDAGSAGPVIDQQPPDDAGSDSDSDASVNEPGGKDSGGPVVDNGGAPAADDDDLGQEAPCQGDINGDGYVDVQDMIEVLINFGTSCP